MYIGDNNFSEGLSILWKENPQKFNAIGGADASIPFGTIFTGMMIAQMYYWGTNQSILQRVFGASSLKEGQKGMILAGFVKFLIPVIVVLPGIIAWHIFQGNLENADQAYPALVRKVLPGAYLGFFAAVLFGAVLSSFNSLLNSSATLFGFDLYKQYFNKNASEKDTVKAGKIFGLFLALVAMSISPFIANAPDGLFSYIQQALGSLSVPILAVVSVGIITKHVPAKAAKIVLTAGVLMYLISLLGLQPYFTKKALESNNMKSSSFLSKMTEEQAIEYCKEINVTNIEAYVKKVSLVEAEAYPHFLHIMGILFVINIIIMLVIGKVSPKTDVYVPKITEEIDITPWKHAKTVGIIITILVLSTYFIFR